MSDVATDSVVERVEEMERRVGRLRRAFVFSLVALLGLAGCAGVVTHAEELPADPSLPPGAAVTVNPYNDPNDLANRSGLLGILGKLLEADSGMASRKIEEQHKLYEENRLLHYQIYRSMAQSGNTSFFKIKENRALARKLGLGDWFDANAQIAEGRAQSQGK